MVKIVLVDDHFMVRDGIRAILEEEDLYEVVGEAANGSEALTLINSLQPDIAICDIRMPEMSGIDMVQQMVSKELPTKTIMLSMHDSDEYILQSINAGADGYLLKGASKEEFLKALTVVSSGEKYFSGDVSSILVKKIKSEGIVDAIPAEEGETSSNTTEKADNNPFELTKRERQILQLAVSGKTNKDIAEELNISKRTIEVHRFNLMKKMGVKNVLELSNKARSYGLIS
ncbi:response regulator [Aquimarina spongiae]|uniref:Two component transcriptional regulator, LuxR family n=1 Tax=Aquimarina spongiae TaxID=570521 RepID=A0A1M6G847_9FLAO|nr:response regulator transcription factor [Aquimarina spongiae]SHJ06153.1 two component transcriptional regulator, LuxR family [Aquimarina spongiae]